MGSDARKLGFSVASRLDKQSRFVCFLLGYPRVKAKEWGIQFMKAPNETILNVVGQKIRIIIKLFVLSLDELPHDIQLPVQIFNRCFAVLFHQEHLRLEFVHGRQSHCFHVHFFRNVLLKLLTKLFVDNLEFLVALLQRIIDRHSLFKLCLP
jgi:hypothetical protein